MNSDAGAAVAASFSRHAALVQMCQDALAAPISSSAERIAHAISRNRKVMICGNGGSAADAQHFAAELVGRFVSDRRPMPAIALTTDTSILTAIANDFAFEQIFSRQLEAIAQDGDILIAISTSGQSPNILAAAQAARRKRCHVIGLLGMHGPLEQLCDIAIAVPTKETARIQEIHLLALHCICEILDWTFAQ